MVLDQPAARPRTSLWFSFKTTVPPATFGYTLRLRVLLGRSGRCSSARSFNDLLVAYQVDPTPADPNANPPVEPYSGNVTFIPDPDDPTKGLPLTITALDPYYDGPGYTNVEPQLQGTGFEQHACSDWFTAKGGVQPGAEVTIGFFLADMCDSNYATRRAARQLPLGLRGLRPERGRRLRRPADVSRLLA